MTEKCTHQFTKTVFGGWELLTGCKKLFYVPRLPADITRFNRDACFECGAPIEIHVTTFDEAVDES